MRRTPTSDVTSFEYAKIFNAALREVKAVKRRYLSQYLRYPFGTLPNRYARDLRAYSVMASATIEQCAEDLVWAHLFHLAHEILANPGTSALLSKAAERLRSLGEQDLEASHGIKGEHFKEVAKAGGFTRTLTALQGNSFHQLGRLRGQAAHTYAITIVDPSDVWNYTKDVLDAVKDLGIACANKKTGFRTI